MIDINKTKAKYLVLDLATYEIREEEKGPAEDPNILNDDKCRTTELWLRRIEPGTFLMGSPYGEKGRDHYLEKPHKVTLTKPYYIGVFEITQKQNQMIGQYKSFKDSENNTRPLHSASYSRIRGNDKGASWPKSNEVDDDSFLGKLRAKTNLLFDLPTEAQWEYACRAGTTTAFNNGKDLADGVMDEIGCCGQPHKNEWEDPYRIIVKTAKVGSYLPNAWGLYDMHGNVWEWCLDWADQYDSDPAINPKGPKDKEKDDSYLVLHRVLRGGSWAEDAKKCRSAFRKHYYSYCCPGDQYQTGFRVVLNISAPLKPNKKSDDKSVKFQTPKNDYKEINTVAPKKAKYLVLDLTTYDIREEEKGPAEDPAILNDNKCRTTELWLRRIEPGTFLAGSPCDEFGHDVVEEQHEKTVEKPFYIGVFEMTQKQYELIANYNPSYFKAATLPVESVSYELIRGEYEGSEWPKGNEVDEYSFLGVFRAKSGLCFDLPTEIQWEYACRAGKTTGLNNGTNITNSAKDYNLAKLGWHAETKEEGTTHKVGKLIPNDWGLYDMHGNVWEWCLDWNEELIIDDMNVFIVPETYRAIRGGSFRTVAYACRAAFRHTAVPDAVNNQIGFRIVLNG